MYCAHAENSACVMSSTGFELPLTVPSADRVRWNAALAVSLTLMLVALLTPNALPSLRRDVVAVLPTAPAPPRRRGALQTSRECACASCASHRALSYPSPAFWPLPTLPVVMESQPGTCDLCWMDVAARPNPCDDMSASRLWAPDPHVREAVVATLGACAAMPGECNMLDIGGNMGVFSLWGWALGARVVYVEPQLDLVTAFAKTVELNCAGDDVTVLHGFISHDASKANSSIAFDGYGYRQCQVDALGQAPLTITPCEARVVYVDEILLAHPRWELLKIDYDADDVDLLAHVLELVAAGAVDVRAFVIEFNDCRGKGHVLQRAHELGYTAYLLNVHLNRRFFDATGHDVVNGYLPVDLGAPLWEEVFWQRGIKVMYKLAKGLSLDQYNEAIGGEIPEFLFTRDTFDEPCVPNESKTPFQRQHGV